MSRNRASAKKAGSDFERLIADGFARALDDDRIDRAVKRGNKDRGDITPLRNPFAKFIIEAKDVAKFDLAGWVREAHTEAGNADADAGVVVVKRRGTRRFADQFVVMTVADLLKIGWGVDDDNATDGDRP